MRRQLADTTYEKEKYNNSNKELREHVKKIESERREQGRTLEETYQKIASQYIVEHLLILCTLNTYDLIRKINGCKCSV